MSVLKNKIKYSFCITFMAIRILWYCWISINHMCFLICYYVRIKVVRNSFMARANWVLINKPNLARPLCHLARAVDAHAQMLILSCRNFGVFITLTAHLSASAWWNFFIFSVITRINWLHT